MPALLTQTRRTQKPKTGKSGRTIVYGEPQSPFQKLIEAARKKKGLSIHELALLIERNKGSVWIWLHNKNGFPSTMSCKPKHIKKLSKALDLPEAEITAALDASRHLYTPRETPMPVAEVHAMREFIETLKAGKTPYLKRSTVINLAESFLGDR